jgi:aminoglycoside phosphotransferase (APT) family kinase protein
MGHIDLVEDSAELARSTAAALGPPMGLGRTAEVFRCGDGEVVKLLRPGFPDSVGESEAEVAALVARAAVRAPRFLGTTRIEGRFGLIYERLTGPSMLDGMSQRPWQIDRLAREFAYLHAAMHAASGDGLQDRKADLRRAIARAGEHLPNGAEAAALARLEALPDGDAICHGDMHPGNVIMTPSGAVVIDWMTARRGCPAGDVARTLFLMRDSAFPPAVPATQRLLVALARRRFSSVYLRHYRGLRPLDLDELAAWRLPVLAARLAEEIEAERAPVQAAIRRELAVASGGHWL